MRTRSRTTALATLVLIAGGILASHAVSGADRTLAPRPLDTRLAGVENIAAPYPWLLTGGQPDRTALAALAAAGVLDLYDLRASDEARGFDEGTVARSLGILYLPIPTRAADFTDARFTAFRHHLIAHGPGSPMFIHCASGNRVGAALLPWLVLDQGMGEDAALEMARGVGLKDPDLTAKAVAYIRARQR